MPRKPKDSAPKTRAANNLVEDSAPLSVKQPFTKVGDRTKGNTNQGSHPLMRTVSRVEEAMDRLQERSKGDELVIEKIEEWKLAVNGMAGTPNGQIFLRMMIKASGLFIPGTARDTVRSVEQKAMQDFYLRHVRPYLDKTYRAEVE